MIDTSIEYKVHDLITNRFSPREFSAKIITDKKLLAILEAGRIAPSSFNEQPWRFIVANRTDETSFERLLSCLSPKNAEWAKNAGALVLSVAKKKFDHDNSLNRHAFHDVGLAVASMVFQAMSLDIYSHQMGGFSSEKARTTFNIPDDYEPVAVVAFGYLDREVFSDERLKPQTALPKKRKPMNEISFANTWGNGISFEHSVKK